MLAKQKTGTLIDASYAATSGKFSVSYRLDDAITPLIRTYDLVVDNAHDNANTLMVFNENHSDVTLSRLDDEREILILKTDKMQEQLRDIMHQMKLVGDHSALLKLNTQSAESVITASHQLKS